MFMPFITEKKFLAMCENLKKLQASENSEIPFGQKKTPNKLNEVIKSQHIILSKDESQNL